MDVGRLVHGPEVQVLRPLERIGRLVAVAVAGPVGRERRGEPPVDSHGPGGVDTPLGGGAASPVRGGRGGRRRGGGGGAATDPRGRVHTLPVGGFGGERGRPARSGVRRDRELYRLHVSTIHGRAAAAGGRWREGEGEWQWQYRRAAVAALRRQPRPRVRARVRRFVAPRTVAGVAPAGGARRSARGGIAVVVGRQRRRGRPRSLEGRTVLPRILRQSRGRPPGGAEEAGRPEGRRR
mmetsp:Transcript_21706/g.63850  ORF Transcript_21706/g.63850 Transcript_21706/m.63850 type:complete len:237 (+) Transcript_21706:1084-1794(+)